MDLVDRRQPLGPGAREGLLERARELGLVGLRDRARHRLERALVEHPGRLAPGAAPDEPALGVGGARVDPRARERARAEPGRVQVLARDHDRAPRRGLVEEPPLRPAAEVRIEAAAEQERPLGQPRGARFDERGDLLGRAPGGVDPARGERVLGEVDVAVAEAGEHGAPRELEAARPGAAPAQELLLLADREHAAAGEGDRARGLALPGLERVDAAAVEDQVGLGLARRHAASMAHSGFRVKARRASVGPWSPG